MRTLGKEKHLFIVKNPNNGSRASRIFHTYLHYLFYSHYLFVLFFSISLNDVIFFLVFFCHQIVLSTGYPSYRVGYFITQSRKVNEYSLFKKVVPKYLYSLLHSEELF